MPLNQNKYCIKSSLHLVHKSKAKMFGILLGSPLGVAVVLSVHFGFMQFGITILLTSRKVVQARYIFAVTYYIH